MLACIRGSRGAWPLEDEQAELAELARSAGAEVVGAVLQRHARYEPATLFSRGKVTELQATVLRLHADTVLCSRDLSPTQQLRLEDAVGVKVIDRTRLILDVFARRAHSREGRVQVELAQCLYMLPRLAALRGELSRLGGGIGTRGPGETQLETDRRHVRARVAALRADLAEVARTREVARGRRRHGPPLVALVGYTNAGKSTLHRALAGSDVRVEDALFATLDPTTRALRLPGNRAALLTDTVGFIHDLPPDLVAAFRSTLEEVTQADLLLEVVDASDPRAGPQLDAVERVLADLGAAGIPRILVWNKVDRLADGSHPNAARSGDPPCVAVSALLGTGLDRLRALIAACLPDDRVAVEVDLSYADEGLVGAVRRDGELIALDYDAGGIHLAARCAPALAARLRAAAARVGQRG